MRSPVADVLDGVARALDALGVRWFLFGAQAAILYGAARLTADVDVSVDLGDRPTADLFAALAAAGFDPRVEATADFVERTRVLPVVHRAVRMPVDVVLTGPGIEEAFLERAERREVGGVSVWVACAEDLVAMKLLAGRPKDLEDVVAVLAARGAAIDLSLARDTLGLLERALDRSDLVPELGRCLRRAGVG